MGKMEFSKAGSVGLIALKSILKHSMTSTRAG